MSDRGQALIEAAFVIPVLIMLLVGGLVLGLATVEDLRLERAAADAALLTESEGRKVVRLVGGRVVCWSETGECFDDGLTVPRIQIIAEGRTWVFPTGQVTPTAQVSRPTETTTEGSEP